eukprot:7396030-Pyramimonas_sp.AAC.1
MVQHQCSDLSQDSSTMMSRDTLYSALNQAQAPKMHQELSHWSPGRPREDLDSDPRHTTRSSRRALTFPLPNMSAI